MLINNFRLQIAVEYLGQNCHFVYLAPLWKSVLDFDMRIDNTSSLVGKDLITGKHYGHKLGGMAGVANVGTNITWVGYDLAQSNLYAYGRLAWDPTRDPEDILHEWTRLTFGLDPMVLNTITEMAMPSWRSFENYSGNLGIQTLTDITGMYCV